MVVIECGCGVFDWCVMFFMCVVCECVCVCVFGVCVFVFLRCCV